MADTILLGSLSNPKENPEFPVTKLRPGPVTHDLSFDRFIFEGHNPRSVGFSYTFGPSTPLPGHKLYAYAHSGEPWAKAATPENLRKLLTRRQAEVFRLYWWGDLNHTEISTRLHITYGVSRLTLCKAKARLTRFVGLVALKVGEGGRDPQGQPAPCLAPV
jgi:hypothetical protein